MLKRPKPGDGEEDILRMQEEFLKEKQKNQNFQPAAQVVNLRTEPSISKTHNNEQTNRKQSKYAQSKGLKSHGGKRVKFEDAGCVIGDIVEKNLGSSSQDFDQDSRIPDEEDKVYYPKIIPSVLGNIVEKNVDNIDLNIDFTPMPREGFPVVTKCNTKLPCKKILGNTSVNDTKTKKTHIDVQGPTISQSNLVEQINLPDKSYIVSSKEAHAIHNENVKLLSNLSENEILEEQKKLLVNLDSKLIDFIKSKRKNEPKQENCEDHNLKMEIDETADENNVKKHDRNQSSLINNVGINITSPKMDETHHKKSTEPETLDDSLWENDVLSHPDVNKWLHFDSLEKDKLNWMKGIEQSKLVNPDEPYEARFDFKGYLLPYTMEYSEKSKPLFHHGEEPHRPGYSLTELFELSRSSIIQQRVMALDTIGGILEYYIAGTYKDVLEIPLSKILFIIRIALDENKVIILEPALKAMRNIIYNRIDEASLDLLIASDGDLLQPSLENDMSEIQELESQESEFNDFHLAELDIIAALLRSDILQRLYYILEMVRPSYNCVQYCLQILIRLARNSEDTAKKIVEMELLMQTIFQNFVPNTGINFVFDPQIVYNGRPILAALKLLRVLSLQSADATNLLINKYDILQPISTYISSVIDRSYGLHLQLEAYCMLMNLISLELGIDLAVSMFPIAITALYKHVQGTDIHVTNSTISLTHCAIVLKFINKLLTCKTNGLEDYKSQVYPLIKEGIQKWLIQLAQIESYSNAHLKLLCSALNCCKTIITVENLEVKFLDDALKAFAVSKGLSRLVENLIPSSNLLSGLTSKDLFSIKNLVSLNSVAIDTAQKILPILNSLSPISFFTSLSSLLIQLKDSAISMIFLNSLSNYIKEVAHNAPSLCDNWFTRLETEFVFNITKLGTQVIMTDSNKDILYIMANKLSNILRIDKKDELDFLFDNIVFNKDWFSAERLMNLMNLSDAEGFSKALTSVEDIRQCYSKVLNVKYDHTGNISLLKWKEPILPRDWIYLPILMLYSKSQEMEALPTLNAEHARKVAANFASEKEFIIKCSLEWILFNETCFEDLLKDIDITDRFCRLMCVFLCDNSLFLDKNINILLRKCINSIFTKKKTVLNFDRDLVGLNNFQDFYTQLLEQFQSVSYGDHTFAACMLVPLAQKHNVKWRKLLWSEYAGCLRALDCPDDLLYYEMCHYLYPEETEKSLIKSYFQALSSNLLRPGTITYKIAKHHVESFINKSKMINK